MGKNSSIAHEILLIFSILIEINLLKHLGLHEKTLNEYENIYQGFCRVYFIIIKLIFYFFNKLEKIAK